MFCLKLENSEQVVFLDIEDVNKVRKYKWYLNKKTGYIYTYTGKNKWIYLHRFILDVQDSKIQIDHVYQNKLDCRKSQLRICTNQQNAFNRQNKGIKKTSKYKGVCWEYRVKKWRATIFFSYKQIYIGTFLDEKEAALAYDNKAKELYGQFANTNFKD
jgi:hypothetical protein